MSKSKHISLFVIYINICLNLLTIPHFINHFYSFFLIVKYLKNNLSNNKLLKLVRPKKPARLVFLKKNWNFANPAPGAVGGYLAPSAVGGFGLVLLTNNSYSLLKRPNLSRLVRLTKLYCFNCK